MNTGTRAPTVGALRRTSLTTEAGVAWTLQASESSSADRPALTAVPATVPGEVHTDLLAATLIPDPFDGDNESALAWIGRTDWTYRATFQWQQGWEARHDLVAQGLDTVAVLTLNGTEVARTANQHRSYRFDVTSLLVEGDN